MSRDAETSTGDLCISTTPSEAAVSSKPPAVLDCRRLPHRHPERPLKHFRPSAARSRLFPRAVQALKTITPGGLRCTTPPPTPHWSSLSDEGCTACRCSTRRTWHGIASQTDSTRSPQLGCSNSWKGRSDVKSQRCELVVVLGTTLRVATEMHGAGRQAPRNN